MFGFLKKLFSSDKDILKKSLEDLNKLHNIDPQAKFNENIFKCQKEVTLDKEELKELLGVDKVESVDAATIAEARLKLVCTYNQELSAVVDRFKKRLAEILAEFPEIDTSNLEIEVINIKDSDMKLLSLQIPFKKPSS
jgi:septum formation topological specificity factor MinE